MHHPDIRLEQSHDGHFQVDHKWDICRLFHHGLQDRGNRFSFHFIVRKLFTAYSQTGFTVILIERGPGVSTKPIKTAYSSVAGTAYVIFDKVSPSYRSKSFTQQGPHKVRVPVSNTLGKIGAGMSVILSNFNHERWMVAATSIGAQRLVVEECLKLVNSFRCVI